MAPRSRIAVGVAFNGVDNVTRVVKGIRGSVTGAMRGLSGTIGRVSGLLAGLGLGFSAAGVIKGIYDTAGALDALDESAKKVGLGDAVGTLSELRYAARLGGVEFGTLDTALGKLNKSTQDARANTGELFTIFKDNAKGERGVIDALLGSTDPAEQFLRLSDALVQARTAGERQRLVMAALGRGGMALLPVLLQGRDAIKAQMEESRRLNPVTAEATRRAAAFKDAQDRVSEALAGVKVAIVSDLMPAVTPLLDAMSRWIASNRELIAQKTVDTIKAIGEALAKIDWEDITLAVKGLGLALGVHLVASLANAAGAIAAHPIIASLAAIGAAIALINHEINNLDDTTGILGKFRNAPFVGTVAGGREKRELSEASLEIAAHEARVQRARRLATTSTMDVFTGAGQPVSIDGTVRIQVEAAPGVQVRTRATSSTPGVSLDVGQRTAGH